MLSKQLALGSSARPSPCGAIAVRPDDFRAFSRESSDEASATFSFDRSGVRSSAIRIISSKKARRCISGDRSCAIRADGCPLTHSCGRSRGTDQSQTKANGQPAACVISVVPFAAPARGPDRYHGAASPAIPFLLQPRRCQRAGGLPRNRPYAMGGAGSSQEKPGVGSYHLILR